MTPTDPPDTDCARFLAECTDWLRESAPARLLVIGEAAGLNAPAGTACEIHADATDLAPAAQYDAVLLCGAPELLARRTGSVLLARARDRLAAQCLAVLPRPCWDETAVLGLGYTLRARSPAALLGHFAIASYKTVPDWFNNRFWANPDRWQP